MRCTRSMSLVFGGALFVACVIGAYASGDGEAGSAETVEIVVFDEEDPTGSSLSPWFIAWQRKFDSEHPNVKVTHLPRTGVEVENRDEWWMTQFQTGSVNLNRFDNIRGAMAMAKLGLSAPFDRSQLTDLDKYIPALIQDSSLDGELYALPLVMEPFGMVVRRSWLEQAGFSPDYVPSTWDEFVDLAKALTDPDTGRFGLAFYALGDAGQNPTEQFLWANGAIRASEDESGRITLHFTDPAVVQTIQFMKDLIYVHKVTGANPAQSWNDAFTTEFRGELGAMSQFYPSWNNWAFTGFDFKQDDLTFFVPPAGPSGNQPYARIGAHAFAIAASSTPAQVSAASAYADHFSDLEYYQAGFEYATENEINFVEPPPRTDVRWVDLATSVPEQWLAPIQRMQQIMIPDPAPNNLSDRYFWTGVGKVFTNPDSNVLEEMEAAQRLAETEWLNKYNAEIQ